MFVASAPPGLSVVGTPLRVSVISYHGVADKSVCAEPPMTFNNASDAITPMDQMTAAPQAVSEPHNAPSHTQG